MKNIEFIKMILSQMTVDEMIDFCGGDCCENVLCKFTGRRCITVNREIYCEECLRIFLNAEHKFTVADLHVPWEAEETDRISELQETEK